MNARALIGILLLVLLALGTSLLTPRSKCIAEEPARAPAPAPRTFELQLSGPDGKPIPNSEVSFRNDRALKREQVKVGEFVKANNNNSRIKTDSTGKVVVELPKVAKYFAIDIEVPGFAPYWAEWRHAENSEDLPEKFVAELDAGWSVGGIVVDSDGQPVKGAEINPSIQFKKRPGDESELYVGATTKTDADGKWHFDCVPVSMNTVSVSIKHPQLMPERRELARSEFGIEAGKEPTAKITLKPGIVLAGHVTDEGGNPVAGARVFTRDRETKTSDDGAYKIAGLGPGKLRLVVTAKTLAMDRKDLQIEPNMEPVDFALKPGGKIRIRVLNKDGQPIPKSRVFFQQWGGKQVEYFEFDKINQYANKEGVWEWDGAPLDALEADICPPNGMQLARQIVTAREKEYVFHPLEALVISGSVIDAKTKEPIKSFRVIQGTNYGQGQLFWNRRDAYTAKGGKYEVRNNRVDRAVVIRIEADGYKPADSEDIKPDDENVSLDFELEKGADIQGVILTPDGNPAAGAAIAVGIPGAQISIRNGDVENGSTYAARITTDKTGKFNFPPQSEAFTLVVTHSSGFAKIASGAEWKQDEIKLQPWAHVEGTFHIGKNTAPHVSLEIQENGFNDFRNDGPRIFSSHETTTDAAGHYIFERVLPGKGYVGRRMIFMMNEGATEVTSSRKEHYECQAGDSLKLDIGGNGRKVTGHLTQPKGAAAPVNWRMAQINLGPGMEQPNMPQPPAEIRKDRQKYAAWMQEWQASPEGIAWRKIVEANQQARETKPYFHASADKDGNFTIDDVPSGSYQLNVYLERQQAGRMQTISRHISVPEAEGDQPDASLDTGDISLDGN